MSLPTYEQALATSREGGPFSNGTERECWMDRNCRRCIHDKDLRDGTGPGCVLISVLYEGRTPAEWTEDVPMSLDRQVRCIYFRPEDDGGDPEPAPVPDPPGQLTLAPRAPFEQARMLTSYPTTHAQETTR
ncbi:hypothetical protein ACQEU3_47145 [Spirillospora sp. CA-253888]